eukprot:114439-Alexandrium_andersonii.AAC.1
MRVQNRWLRARASGSAHPCNSARDHVLARACRSTGAAIPECTSTTHPHAMPEHTRDAQRAVARTTDVAKQGRTSSRMITCARGLLASRACACTPVLHVRAGALLGAYACVCIRRRPTRTNTWHW